MSSKCAFGPAPDPAADASGGNLIGRRRLLGGAGGLLASAAILGRRLEAKVPLIKPNETSCAGTSDEMPALEFVLQARVSIAPGIELGNSSRGHRRIVPITGGSFHGPRLSGTVLDEGEDTQLLRPDGVTEITARYVLRTDDGVGIYVVNSGLIAPAQAQQTGQPYKRTIPRFDAPSDSRYGWLNCAIFVGTLHRLATSEHAVLLRFFKVL